MYLLTYIYAFAPKYLGDIFSGLVNAFQKATGTGDYDSAKLKAATQGLQQVAPYLHFDDLIHRIITQFQWGIIKAIYHIADWANDLATQSLDFGKILKFQDLVGKDGHGGMVGAAVATAAGLMVICVIWAAIKIMTQYHAPSLKSVVMNVMISSFLIFGIQPITNYVVDMSTGMYKDFTNGKDGTTSLPYELVQKNSNDLLAIMAHNFGEFTVNNGNVKTDFGGLKKRKGKVVDQGDRIRWGSLSMDKNDFDTASAGDLSTVITPTQAKEFAQQNKNWAWNPDNLRYKLTPTGVPSSSSGKTKSKYSGYTASKINDSTLPFFKIFNGGYERFTNNFIPTVIGLLALTGAFLLVAWVSVRAFLDLAIMQVLAIFVFSTDIEKGERTKRAVESIFNSALLIAFEGFELAFYRIVVSWLSDSQWLSNNPYLFAVVMIAATWSLFEGSTKVSEFFGLDTGLKNGWQRTIQTAGAGVYLAKQVGNAGKATTTVGHKAKDSMQRARAMSTAEHQARSNGATHSEALAAGFNAGRAFDSVKKDFLQNGGTRSGFNNGMRSGVVQRKVSDMVADMNDKDGQNGLTDDEFAALNRSSNYGWQQAKAEQGNSTEQNNGSGSAKTKATGPNKESQGKSTIQDADKKAADVDKAKKVSSFDVNDVRKPINTDNETSNNKDNHDTDKAEQQSKTNDNSHSNLPKDKADQTKVSDLKNAKVSGPDRVTAKPENPIEIDKDKEDVAKKDDTPKKHVSDVENDKAKVANAPESNKRATAKSATFTETKDVGKKDDTPKKHVSDIEAEKAKGVNGSNNDIEKSNTSTGNIANATKPITQKENAEKATKLTENENGDTQEKIATGGVNSQTSSPTAKTASQAHISDLKANNIQSGSFPEQEGKARSLESIVGTEAAQNIKNSNERVSTGSSSRNIANNMSNNTANEAKSIQGNSQTTKINRENTHKIKVQDHQNNQVVRNSTGMFSSNSSVDINPTSTEEHKMINGNTHTHHVDVQNITKTDLTSKENIKAPTNNNDKFGK